MLGFTVLMLEVLAVLVLPLLMELNPNGMDPDEFDELFQSYSDFYKDVYGHRPRDIQNPWKLAI